MNEAKKVSTPLTNRGSGVVDTTPTQKKGKELEKRSTANLGDIDQMMDQSRLEKMVQEKLDSAQNSEVKKYDRQSSMISQGSLHQVRMKDTTLDHPKVLSSSKHPIIRICLTGGPCAGKTTAMATLNQRLS